MRHRVDICTLRKYAVWFLVKRLRCHRQRLFFMQHMKEIPGPIYFKQTLHPLDVGFRTVECPHFQQVSVLTSRINVLKSPQVSVLTSRINILKSPQVSPRKAARPICLRINVFLFAHFFLPHPCTHVSTRAYACLPTNITHPPPYPRVLLSFAWKSVKQVSHLHPQCTQC